MTVSPARIDLSKPRYDQSTFEGRAKHFFITTNPLNVLISDSDLDRAEKIVKDYERGEEDKSLTEDEIWRAKAQYDSAFHCQTGEKLFLPGRMSCQVPGNMCITGCMMTFYKTAPAVIFWQSANQAFNAVVNYTNRNASVPVSNEQLGTAALGATSAGVITALSFNKLISSYPVLQAGIVGRLVPLMAVAAANCVNIPMMRQQEVTHGITITLEDGTEVGKSGNAAKAAIAQVIPSRIGMAIPGMFIPPACMMMLEKTKLYIKNPWLKAPTTVLLTGMALTFSTPICCAFFPQTAAIKATDLEAGLRANLEAKYPGRSTFYYNKGL